MHSHEEASRHVAGSSIVDIANQIFIAKRAIYENGNDKFNDFDVLGNFFR